MTVHQQMVEREVPSLWSFISTKEDFNIDFVKHKTSKKKPPNEMYYKI